MTRAATPPATMTPTQFTEFISQIPFTPTIRNARGLLAPLLRSMGHILYLTAQLSNTEHPTTMTEEQQKNELVHAAEHLDASAVLASDNISSNAKNLILTYQTAVLHARDSFAAWPATERAGLLAQLSHRAAAIAAALDRELVGLAGADSDPGTSL